MVVAFLVEGVEGGGGSLLLLLALEVGTYVLMTKPEGRGSRFAEGCGGNVNSCAVSERP